MADTPEKPATTKTAAAKPVAPRKPATPRKAPAAKSATKSATKSAAKPAATRKPATKKASNAKASDKSPGKWSNAAIVGGVAAVGAVAGAALLALRGSSAVGTITETLLEKTGLTEETTPNQGKAHQADGTDSTASFQAGIADEGTIPN